MKRVSHRWIIDLWARRRTFAEDIGVPVTLVACWYARQRIPSDYWPRIIECATANALVLTLTFEDFYRDEPAQAA